MGELQIARDLLATKIGYAVRTARLRRGMAVEELADRSGVSVPTIKKIERGEYTGQLGTLGECLYALDYEPFFRLVPNEPNQ